MSDLIKAANENFSKQIEPETSSYECFFHYTDDKLFEAGFIEGFEYAQKQANGVDKSTEPALHKHIVMPRFNDDYEEDEFEDEEPDGYECMSCGNIQFKHVGLSCNRCCGPLTEWYL